MPRLLFTKTGSAVWMSHLDLMRLFQRAFKRAGLHLTHTQGYNPRPSVSIALPLSVGTQSVCELLDFELNDENINYQTIRTQLNRVLVQGVEVLDVYENEKKIRDLAYLRCEVVLHYDVEIPCGAQKAIQELFSRSELMVVKKTKNGPKDQDIIPMIRNIRVSSARESALVICALVCCQNPTLNPSQLVQAIHENVPQYAPDHITYRRLEIYDKDEKLFR